MSTDALTQAGIIVAAYALLLWFLTWPLRNASWLQSLRFDAQRKQALRSTNQRGGR